jgi:Domain of unknown function (DUF4398)
VKLVSLSLGLACLAIGCATTSRAPELVSARAAYASAAQGPAASLAPVDLEAARVALERAEKAFAASEDAAPDLAYLAQRKAELAEARAGETQDVEAADREPL